MGGNIIYDINPRDKRTKGEEYLLSVFENSERFNGWTIFEQPHIDSVKPDFIILHPKRGIIIIEVKDWSLNLDLYVGNGNILGTDNRLHDKNPLVQVNYQKKCISKTDMDNTEDFVESNDKYYGCIETVVYFHGTTKKQAEDFCGESKYTKIWTDEDIDIIKGNAPLNPRQYTYALAYESSKFNKDGNLEKYVEELIKRLSYSDYRYERRKPFKLNGEQNRLAELKHNSIRRWSGVAGAGKSLVLAEKASRALKENNRVIILTYNITLRSYLRDLCSQQFGVEDDRKKLRRDLTIVHFHGLLMAIAAKYGIELNNVDDNDSEDFTEEWINKINSVLKSRGTERIFKYDYILIDEGQDFKSDWIRFLKQFFTKRGEILIVYDKAQDIYDHGLWIEDKNEIKDIGFRNTPGTLKHTYRLPKDIVEKIGVMRSILNIKADEILLTEKAMQQTLFHEILWHNKRADNITQKLSDLEDEMKQLLENNNNLDDITILTTNENTGIEIVKHFNNKGVKVSHVYDITGQKSIDKRRSEKFKFNGGTGRLKVCSYHSYKGWQTPNIILVLDIPSTKYYNGII